MRIKSVEQAETLRSIIGDENVEACGRALADRAKVWVFQTEAEAQTEQELTEEERQFCLNRFASGETWAGIYRTPETPPVPGFTPHRGYDTHGNSRGQGNDGLNRQWCH